MQKPSISFYARSIRPHLDEAAFAPAPLRLLWLLVHGLVIVVSIAAMARYPLPWPALLGLSLLIGVSFGCLTFLGHEVLHGSVIHDLRLRNLVGWLCFMPFMIAPTLWIAWHNRVHHGRTNRPNVDPDAYPTLQEYQRSPAIRFVTDHLAPGRRRWLTTIASLLFGFSGQSLHMLLDARRRGYLSRRQHAYAMFQSVTGLALWSAVAYLVGGQIFLFCFVLPLLVANGIVMSFIFTNHSLSPLTESNDPLANSLSVTTPRWVEWLTLRFGFHVEHHIFPAMSSRHAIEVRQVLRQRWPDRYQSRSLWRALIALQRSPRVYKTHETLVDPKSGDEWPTYAPEAKSPHRQACLGAGNEKDIEATDPRV